MLRRTRLGTVLQGRGSEWVGGWLWAVGLLDAGVQAGDGDLGILGSE